MDTKRLMYFCTIVEQGQISRAARALNMSQPPLSQRLKELEDELGVQLIMREGHAWQVTESGKVLYDRARQILDSLGELSAEVKNTADGFGGRISIGTSTTCLSSVMDLAPLLTLRFPRLQWRLFVSDSSSLERHVQNRDLDFAVLILPTLQQDYVTSLLPPDRFSVVFQPHRAPQPAPAAITLEDLRDQPLLLLRRWEGGGSYEHLVKGFQKKGISPRIVMNSPDARVLLDCMERGLEAAAIVPNREIPARVRERFPIYPLDMPGMMIQPALIHLKDRYLTGAARAVIEAITGTISAADAGQS